MLVNNVIYNASPDTARLQNAPLRIRRVFVFRVSFRVFETELSIEFFAGSTKLVNIFISNDLCLLCSIAGEKDIYKKKN